MSLLKIPQGWKPKNAPDDPRGYHDPRIYLSRMNARLKPKVAEPMPEEEEAFRELEQRQRDQQTGYPVREESLQAVPLADYERVVQVLLESSVPPKHSIFVSELMMKYQTPAMA